MSEQIRTNLKHFRLHFQSVCLGRNLYVRRRVVCPYDTDGGLTRSLTFCKNYGMAEVYGDLAVWLANGATGGIWAESHGQRKPTVAQVHDSLVESGLPMDLDA